MAAHETICDHNPDKGAAQRPGWRKDGDDPAVVGKAAADSASDYTASDSEGDEYGDQLPASDRGSPLPKVRRHPVAWAVAQAQTARCTCWGPLRPAGTYRGDQSLEDAQTQLRTLERQASRLRRHISVLRGQAAAAADKALTQPGHTPCAVRRCVLCQAAIDGAKPTLVQHSTCRAVEKHASCCVFELCTRT